MKNILIKDNFFDSVDELRELALSYKYADDDKLPWHVGWRGRRSTELFYEKSDILNECIEKISKTVCDFYNLVNYDCTRYFHLVYESDVIREGSQYHRDHTVYAGVLYLSPNPSKDSGTTIFVPTTGDVVPIDNPKRIDIENKYNRLVIYPGYWVHGPTAFFGDTKIDGRLTMSFFFDPYININRNRVDNKDWYNYYKNDFAWFV